MLPLAHADHPLIAQSAAWLDYLVSVVLLLPCALPILAVVILCIAMIARQARNDRPPKN